MRIVKSENWNEPIPPGCSFGIEENSEHAYWKFGERKSTFIHYVLTGEGVFDNKKVKAGQGFLVTANVPHMYHSSNENPWTYFWVGLGDENATPFCKKHLPLDENEIFNYNFRDELQIFAKDFFNENTKVSAIKSLSIFMWLLSMHEQKKEPKHNNKYVHAAIDIMKDNLHREISIKEIAESLFINDRYLYNLFIRHEGVSPKAYLNKLKLQKACALLQSGGYSISDVARHIGFNDVLVFSRFFSKHMHISPSAYRKKQ